MQKPIEKTPPPNAAAPENQQPKASVAHPIARAGRSAREGRVLIGGHFAPEVQIALKVIAAEERTTVQNLLAEAIDAVFAKRGKPPLATLPPKA